MTPSQQKRIKQLENEPAQGTLKKVSYPEYYSDRIRLFFKCEESGFTYHLYIGKRGKVYETPDGDY